MEVEVSACGMVAVVLCDNPPSSACGRLRWTSPAVCVTIHFPDIFAAASFYKVRTREQTGNFKLEHYTNNHIAVLAPVKIKEAKYLISNLFD